MKVPFVNLKLQYQSIKSEIDSAIKNVLTNATFIGGKNIDFFESNFSSYMGTTHCISCANGTDAIELALEALDIGEGDEVIVPVYTWLSTASAVIRVGAKPIFVDVHPDYYTIDVRKIEKKITCRTKAIIPVHLYGLPASMDSILLIAKKYRLKVIEDCSQAHSASIKGKKISSFGDIGTFSFYPSKNLGAYGNGGAILTNSSHLEEKIRIIAHLGQVGKNNHIGIGRNSRLDGLQAAILNVKINHLSTWTNKRKRIAAWYLEALKDSKIKLPACPEESSHVYHLFVIQTNRRDELKQFLAKKGIDTQIHYPNPLHKIGIFGKNTEKFPVAEAMSSQLLSLPIYPELTKVEVEYVSSSIHQFCNNNTQSI